jgi:hypothetical protein
MSTSQTTKHPTFKTLIKSDLKAMKQESIAKKIISVRYDSFSMGDSVDVKSIDLGKKDREILENLLAEYKSGSYNSLEDLYEYKKTKSKTRTAKFVSLKNEFSDSTKAKIKKSLEEKGVIDNDSSWKILNCWYDEAMWKGLTALETI